MDCKERVGALQTFLFILGLGVSALGVSMDEEGDDLGDRELVELCLSVHLPSLEHPCTLRDSGGDI